MEITKEQQEASCAEMVEWLFVRASTGHHGENDADTYLNHQKTINSRNALLSLVIEHFKEDLNIESDKQS